MHSDLQLINEFIFKPAGFEISNIETELESLEYSAQTFRLGQHKVKFRTAKITPTKTGQFVTLWKRNSQGITEPHNFSDDFDFYIIATRTDSQFGIFIFQKAVLHENCILSDNFREGKRGFRVYPPWDSTINKQAQKTQIWQINYFLELTQAKTIDLQKTFVLLTTKKASISRGLINY